MEDLTPAWTERNAPEVDRSVLIAGQEFTYRTGTTPEELASLPDPQEGMPPAEMFSYLDQLIKMLLIPSDHARYEELRKRVEDPLTAIDVRSAYDGLLQKATGRNPTRPPSSSSPPKEPGTNSMGDSSEALAAVSSPST